MSAENSVAYDSNRAFSVRLREELAKRGMPVVPLATGQRYKIPFIEHWEQKPGVAAAIMAASDTELVQDPFSDRISAALLFLGQATVIRVAQRLALPETNSNEQTIYDTAFYPDLITSNRFQSLGRLPRHDLPVTLGAIWLQERTEGVLINPEDHADLSQRHAQLSLDPSGGGLLLEDIGSLAGTEVVTFAARPAQGLYVVRSS